jgi:FkbM family methyltransferase
MNHFKYYSQLFKCFGFFKGISYHLASKCNFRLIMEAKIANQRIFVRTNSRDFQVALSNLVEGEFEELPINHIAGHKGIIVDAGGYIGTSAIALSLLFPSKSIFCIEPDDENFVILQRNTRFFPNIFLINAALASSETKSTMLYNRTSEYGYTIVSDPLDNPLAKPLRVVDCIGIDEIVSKNSNAEISLLKMDIEGGEVAVLLGSSSWINRVFCIYVELHDRIDNRCGSVFEDATTRMHLWPTRSEKVCRIREFASNEN